MAAPLVLLLPLARIVELASFGRSYLERRSAVDGTECRTALRRRVESVLDKVIAKGGYDRVSLVAHSFGSVIAIDVMADYVPASGTHVRFVTLGSPVFLLSARSTWMAQEVKRCRKSNAYAQWDDYWSKNDWICHEVPGEKSTGSHHSYPLEFGGSIAARLIGRTHNSYFDSQRVMTSLVTGADDASLP